MPLLESGICVPRVKAASEFFRRQGYNLPFLSICNDAVHILAKLDVRLPDCAILGFAFKDENLSAVCSPDTLAELKAILAENPLATQADAWIASPLDPAIPSYVLAVFAQTSTPPAEDILRRFNYISAALQPEYCTIAYCADGAAPQLKAMHLRREVHHIIVHFTSVSSLSLVPC